MSSSIATAYLQLVPTMKGAQGTISKELVNEAGPASEKAGRVGGARFSKGMGIALGATAALATATAGAFAGLYKVGGVFDSLRVGISSSTGAMGDDLDSLEATAKKVGDRIPVNFEDVGGALSALRSTTQATGPELEGTLEAVLQASRVLGEDGTSNAESFGKALEQWNIPAEEGADKMDVLFSASQQYGTSLGGLTGSLNAYGSVLQNAGFSMEESTALFGQLESSGLSVSRVMPGLNSAFRKWAGEGKNVQDELDGTVDSIKNAETSQEALTLATEAFGAEGAQRLTTAIRNGKFELGDLDTVLGDTTGAVDKSAEAAMSAGEYWQIFKNNVLTALEPVATKVFDTFGDMIGVLADLSQKYGPQVADVLMDAMDAIGPMLGTVFDAFGELAPMFGDLLSEIIPVITQLSPLRLIFEALQPVLPTLIDAVKTLASALGGALAVVLPVVVNVLQALAETLTGALMSVLPAVVGVVAALAETISDVLPAVLPVIDALMGALVPILLTLVDALLPLVEALLPIMADLLMALLPAVAPIVNILGAVLTPVINVVGDVLGVVIGVIGTAIEWFAKFLTSGDKLQAGLAKAWDAIKIALNATWTWIHDHVIQPFVDAGVYLWDTFITVKDGVNNAWSALKEILRKPWEWVRDHVLSIFSQYITNLKNNFGKVRDGISIAWTALKGILQKPWEWVRDHVLSIFSQYITNLKNNFGKVRDGISTAWSALKDILRKPWEWIRDHVIVKFKKAIEAIPDAFDSAKKSIKRVWDGIKSIAAKPINFVIDTVYNKGIKAAVDKISGFLHLNLTLPKASTVKFAQGTEDHRAQIAGPGAMRLWAEPETGGEAYIPLGDSKRQRSTDILGQVANGFGYGLTPFAGGGFWGGVGNFFSGAWDLAKDVGQFVMHPVEGIKHLVKAPVEAALKGIGGGNFGELISGIPRALVAGISKNVKDIFKLDEAGAPGDGTWQRPTAGRVTSGYGSRWGGFHGGIDISNGGGLTYAAQAGLVKKTGWNILSGFTGIGILLDHLNGWRSYYGHNPSMGSVKVHPGQSVKQGQHIGQQGATGNATGPHLHFSTWHNGHLVNPTVTGLFDQGGLLQPGHAAVNMSSSPEPVLTGNQWQTMRHQGPTKTERRSDMEYLAGMIITGLAGMAHDAGLAGDLARNGRLRARMNGATG